MTHRHYCTYFDHRYLTLGLALHESLVRHGGAFTLWVLAFDHEAADFLDAAALPNVRVVPLETLEAFDAELKASASTRSRVEYYFTCSPCLPRYLMLAHGVPEITYLDSDLWFFSSPEAVFDELGDGSVAIVPHRFTGASAASHAQHGAYNVGWLTFRADARGRACLEWWRERCIEWCYDRVEADRYADQKYLDRFQSLFEGVRPISNPGANLAPWNVAGSTVTLDGDAVHVDGTRLVFFHFQGFRRLEPETYDSNLTSYGARMTPALREGVFRPYIAALRRAEAFVAPRLPQAVGAQGIRRAGLHQWRLRASRAWRTWRARLAGNLVDAPLP
jgi:hypothetical protein